MLAFDMNVLCESGVHAYSSSSPLYTIEQKTLMHKRKQLTTSLTCNLD